jgi:DNA polymerase-3 subunit alpha
MPEGLDETPSDRYYKFKNNIDLWYKEMNDYGLTKSEQKVLERHCLADYGVPSSQEAAMMLFMDKEICGFTLEEANSARKVISKKKMDKIPELKQQVISRAKSKKLGQYVWQKIIALQMGYSFN